MSNCKSRWSKRSKRESVDGDAVKRGVCARSAAEEWNVWCDGGECAGHECDDGGGRGEIDGRCSLAC